MAKRAGRLCFVIRRHGGRRAGAGRKAVGARRNVAHRPREPHRRYAPAHVTLRAATLPASLRAPGVFPVVSAALGRASREEFRVVAFSVQHDHVHMIVEADDGSAFVRGIQGLAIRVAKAVNRVLGRHGAVWADRFHARDLTTPRAVRHALVYVLHNWKKHRLHRGQRVDPCSSARWFSGWKNLRIPEALSAPVVTARTWLARWGWRRYGLMGWKRSRSPRERRRGVEARTARACGARDVSRAARPKTAAPSSRSACRSEVSPAVDAAGD
jgi:putative transposase